MLCLKAGYTGSKSPWHKKPGLDWIGLKGGIQLWIQLGRLLRWKMQKWHQNGCSVLSVWFRIHLSSHNLRNRIGLLHQFYRPMRTQCEQIRLFEKSDLDLLGKKLWYWYTVSSILPTPWLQDGILREVYDLIRTAHCWFPYRLALKLCSEEFRFASLVSICYTWTQFSVHSSGSLDSKAEQIKNLGNSEQNMQTTLEKFPKQGRFRGLGTEKFVFDKLLFV